MAISPSGSTTSLDKLLDQPHQPHQRHAAAARTDADDNVSVSTSIEIDPKDDDAAETDSLSIPDPPSHEPPSYVKSLSAKERAAAERALVRKIDLRLIPAVVVMYILNYLDRTNIASARLAGLEDDLNLRGTQYQTCVSILFVGYLIMQIPSNLFLNKIGKPSLYLPICMMVWGLVSMATAAVQNFAGLLSVRFLLGFVEAPYFPGCLYFLSTWYTRKELAFRTTLLYSGSLIATAFSGLMAAGITGSLDGVLGLSAWRWLFVMEGAMTVFIAFSAIFVLPDFPRTTDWLTPEEKALAIWRLNEDIGENDWVSSDGQSFGHGFVLACKDVKMWLLMLMLFCNAVSGSVTNFFPTVVQTLGYGRIESLLLTAPPYMLCVVTAIVNAWHSDRSGERYFHITLPLYIAIGAFAIAAATTATVPRYLSMMLMVPGIYTGYVVSLGWISNTMPRPPAKRAAALAFINAVSNTSSIFTSYMYSDTFAPRYVLAMTVCSCAAAVAVLCATLLRAILVTLNRKLDRGERVEGAINSGQAIPGEAARRGFRFLI